MNYSVFQRASGIPLAIYQVGAKTIQISSEGCAPKSCGQVGGIARPLKCNLPANQKNVRSLKGGSHVLRSQNLQRKREIETGGASQKSQPEILGEFL